MRFSPSTLLKSLGLMAGGAAIFWLAGMRPGQSGQDGEATTPARQRASRPSASDSDLSRVVNPACPTLTEQAKALISLQRPLTPEQTRILLDLVAEPSKANASSMEWACLVNEALNCLRRQPATPPDLVARLAALAANPSAGLLLQDYAIQHLGIIYQGLPPNHPDYSLIHSILGETAAHQQRARSGTAILALGDRLAKADPSSPEVTEFTGLLGRVISSPQSHPEARMSAFAQASNLRLAAIAPLARQVAFSSVYSIPERKTAIACLGRTGAQADLENLSRLASSQPSLVPAVDNAVKLLQQQND